MKTKTELITKADSDPQMDLLNIYDADLIENREQYVHLVELWDLLYLFDDRSSVYSNSLEDLTSTHTMRQGKYQLQLTKSGTRVENGRYKRPGTREKKVLDTIRYMAAQGYGDLAKKENINVTTSIASIDRVITVDFNNEDIRRISRDKFNYTISGKDISEAIKVLSSSELEIDIKDTTNEKSAWVITRPVISRISSGDRYKHRVELHPLLSATIIKTADFQLQNVKYFGYAQITQILMNKIHLRFTQAREDNYYHFNLSTFYNESLPEEWPTFKGPDMHKVRDNLWKRVKRALDNLKQDNVIKDYVVTNKTHEYKARAYWHDKTIDVHFTDDYVKDRVVSSVATRQIRDLEPRESITTSVSKVIASNLD